MHHVISAKSTNYLVRVVLHKTTMDNLEKSLKAILDFDEFARRSMPELHWMKSFWYGEQNAGCQALFIALF